MSKKTLVALLISISAHLAVVMAFAQQDAEQRTMSMGAIQAPVALSFSTVIPPPPEPVVEKKEAKPEPKSEPEPVIEPEPVERAKSVLETPKPEPVSVEEPEEPEEIEAVEEVQPEPLPEPIAERTALEESEIAGLSNEPVMVSEPAIRNWSEPRYPRAAQRRNQQGVVMLDIFVDEQGNPFEISVLSSSGYPALDNAAIAAVKRWEFAPEKRNNQLVKSRVHIPVVFKLN